MEGEVKGLGRAFARGFAALAPLWIGVMPFGLAYAVIARDAGLSILETRRSRCSSSRAALR